MSVVEVAQTVRIRAGEPHDVAACAELAYALRETTHWGRYPKPDLRDVVTFLIGLPYVAVAECEGDIVGLCGGRLQCHPCYPQHPYLLEEVFYVRPSFRHATIGMQLLRAFRSWGREQGAVALVVGRPTLYGETMRWHELGEAHA